MDGADEWKSHIVKSILHTDTKLFVCHPMSTFYPRVFALAGGCIDTYDVSNGLSAYLTE